MTTKYPNLISPITIRGKTFKNRMIVAPLGYGPVDNDEFYLHAENIEYYEALARGGSARVITGDHPVNSYNAGYGGQRLDFYSERSYHPRFEHSIGDFVRAVHQHGALAFTEFDHGGQFERNTEVPPWGPTGFVRQDGVEVLEMDREMIESVCQDFVRCCVRAKELGLDGVMIHGGHAHIQDQFRSRETNKRTDEYGGSLINRCRFTIECLERMREAVGEKFLIEYRFSVLEGSPDGISVDESIEFMKLIDSKGLVDIFHVSTGVHFDARYNAIMSSCAYMPNMYNLENCKKIKAAGIMTPIAMCNGVNDPDAAEAVIREGVADFVTMARQLNIADPYFPRKIMEGRPEYINTCLRCYSCYDGYECAVNVIHPSKYRDELRYSPVKTDNPRKVVVVGGGIAGLKAAETASCAGHEVILLEKENYLGGLLRFTDTDMYKRDIERLKNNIIRRVRQAENVEIRLSVEATPELVRRLEPDALIVCVGSEPAVPDIPGAYGENVVSMMDVYDYPEQVGDSVAVIGGGLSACEVAMHLGKSGHKVTIVGRRERLAYYEKPAVPVFDCVPGILEEYATFERPVEVVTGCEVVEIVKGGVIGLMVSDGSKAAVKCDTVVLASGMKAKDRLAYSFAGIAPYFRVAGDCFSVGKIKQAIRAAHYAVMDIDR